MKESNKLQRKYVRNKVNLEIEYLFNKETRIKAHLLDLSMKGAKIRTNHILEKDDIIHLFFVNDEMPIQILVARVKYRVGNTIGVKFDLTDDSIIFLSKYIKENSKIDKYFF